MVNVKERVKKLKAMDYIMRTAENEQVTIAWLMGGVPDDADEDDFESIAAEDEVYFDVCDCFVGLVHRHPKMVFGIRG